MVRIRSSFIGLFATVFAASCLGGPSSDRFGKTPPGGASPQQDRQPPSRPFHPEQAALDEYLRALAHEYGFSGAVLVAEGDRVLVSAGYGFADDDRGIPASADTRFAIASATKPFTATALMLLVRDGRIDLSDPVCRYLRGCPRRWAGIRIANLLDHTSGLADRSPRSVDDRALAEVVSGLKREELLFPPGDDHTYANANYHLAGYIVEQVTGSSWPEFLEARILSPLGLGRTTVDRVPAATERAAVGYMTSLSPDGDRVPVTEAISDLAGHGTPNPDPAGGLISTVGDLHRFARSLDEARVLPPALLRTMWTPTGPGRYGDYGLGWETFPQNGTRVVQHGGGMPGFSSCISLYPREDLYVIVLSNVTESVACEYIARDLGAIVLGQPYRVPDAPDPRRIPVGVLRTYVGVYRGGSSHTGPAVRIRLVDGRLEMRGLGVLGPPLNDASLLRPWSRTRFFNPHDPYVGITFDRRERHRAVALVLHQPAYRRLPAGVERFRRTGRG